MPTVTFEANTSKELKTLVQEWLDQQEKEKARLKLQGAIQKLEQVLCVLEDPVVSDLEYGSLCIADMHSHLEEDLKDLSDVFDANFLDNG